MKICGHTIKVKQICYLWAPGKPIPLTFFLSGQSWVYVSVLPSGVGKRKLCETVLFSQIEWIIKMGCIGLLFSVREREREPLLKSEFPPANSYKCNYQLWNIWVLDSFNVPFIMLPGESFSFGCWKVNGLIRPLLNSVRSLGWHERGNTFCFWATNISHVTDNRNVSENKQCRGHVGYLYLIN